MIIVTTHGFYSYLLSVIVTKVFLNLICLWYRRANEETEYPRVSDYWQLYLKNHTVRFTTFWIPSTILCAEILSNTAHCWLCRTPTDQKPHRLGEPALIFLLFKFVCFFIRIIRRTTLSRVHSGVKQWFIKREVINRFRYVRIGLWTN